MTEEQKKRKRRRRSKEKTNDDAVVNQEAAAASDDDKASKEHASDNEDDVPIDNDDDVQIDKPVDPTENNKDQQDDEDAAVDKDDEPKKRKRKRKRKNKEDTTTTASPLPSSTKESTTTTTHTVFIEGLPFTSTPHAIRTFFESYNCGDIIEMRLPTWQDSGRLRGFGHVVFASEETYKRALEEVNGKELGGRYVSVFEAKEPSRGECVVYMFNVLSVHVVCMLCIFR